MEKDKILEEIKEIKAKNEKIVTSCQKMTETIINLKIDVNKLICKLEDVEYKLKNED